MSARGKSSLSPRPLPNNPPCEGCLRLLCPLPSPGPFRAGTPAGLRLSPPRRPRSPHRLQPLSRPAPVLPAPQPLTSPVSAGVPVPAARAAARRAPGSRWLPRQCQPRCPAWVWDRAARGTGAAQGRAGREGGGTGAGTRAGAALSPRARDPAVPCGRPCGPGDGGSGARDATATLPGQEELTAQGSSSPPSFAPELSSHPAREPRATLALSPRCQTPSGHQSNEAHRRGWASQEAARVMTRCPLVPTLLSGAASGRL